MQRNILIVDDNKVNRSILHRILQEDFNVIEAEDGLQAYEIIKKEHRNLDAVILDLIMPKMGGQELLEKLAKNESYANLPILIATGERDEAIESECLDLGAWDFVSKPYSQAVIKTRLRNIIARSRNALMEQIQELAQKDTLTGIYNRQFFMKKTSQLLKDYPDETFVLGRLDIDHFRVFNSSFGTKKGDEFLKKISGEIERTVEKHHIQDICTYGRIVSDIFCFCVPYREKEMLQTMKDFNEKLEKINTHYRIKASFGLYIIDDHMEDMEAMYTRATDAALKCKNNMNMHYAFYSKEMSVVEERDQRFTNEMSHALVEKQFLVYLQPKYRVDTGKPCGAEALVRWKHPEWGMVSPGEFIPAFEHNGLIVQLDYYMWEHVCMLLSDWVEKEGEVYPISVNISRISLYNPDIVDEIVALTEKYHVPKQLLNLEITESAYMSSPDLMKETISKFRALGFVILMDDFGSGYSSLNTLKNIEVDILKIDMKFLPTGQSNGKSEKILASVARMAGWLGMPVVVEGVETKEQKDFLESIGCSYIQGYYYARPMPIAEYIELVREQKPLIDEKIVSSNSPEKFLKSFDEIWSSDSNSGILLKSIPVAFAIMEYSDGKVDILRRNKEFQKVFGNTVTSELLSYREQAKLTNTIDDMILSREQESCDLLFTLPNGKQSWQHCRMIYLGTIEKTSLLSITLADVTTERLMEKEINHIFNELEETGKSKNAILVVDDLAISREVLTSLFEESYTILTAETGEKALVVLKNHYKDIAVILLDMIMPGMNGEEFLLYKNGYPQFADIPVVVISSESGTDLQINMLEHGVNDYVTKPFVPAVVKRRVRNVIEYNSRFRSLVKEFHVHSKGELITNGTMNLTQYSYLEIASIIHFMKNIFEVVRLVDPTQTAIVNIDRNGIFSEEQYTCFKVWNKEVRCDNCSSMCALQSRCSKTKFELMKDNIFYVVSQPVEILNDKGEVMKLVLEIVSEISDGDTLQKEEVSDVYALLSATHRMIYEDPLTKVYNRRYFEEAQFLHHKQNGIATEIAFIMMDVKHFKYINDEYGHLEGDKVLKDAAMALQSQVRESDSVIRYGGDEFVIVLTNCDENTVKAAIERFENAVMEVRYGKNKKEQLKADFGYSYSNQFVSSEISIQEMLKEADMHMYEAKKSDRDSFLNTEKNKDI